MAKQDGPAKRIIKDGMISFLGGVHSGIDPSLIDANQVAYAENVTFRGGYPWSRPGFSKRVLTFDNSEQQAWYENHALQGGFTYRAAVGNNFKVVSVGGRIFKIDILGGYTVTELTPSTATATTVNYIVPAVGATVPITVADASHVFIDYPLTINGHRYLAVSKTGNVITAENLDDVPAALILAGAPVLLLDPNDPNIPRVYFEQATKWLICQNLKDDALLFDGGAMRRSNTKSDKPEVPVGGVMAFTNNRLWLETPGNQVAAGDIAGGETDVIVFSEELGPLGPVRFQIEGKITAMVKTVTLDTTLGQGPLQIFTRDSCSSIRVPANRALWSQLTYPIQTIALTQAGALSQYGVVQVNSDIHYRAADGWRSFIMARRDMAEWFNTPVSIEVNRTLDDDDESLLHYGSAILFDSRVLFTVNPQLTENGVAHRGMAVLDFNLINSMGRKLRPVWDGVWSGVRPTLLLTGTFAKIKRAFVFALGEAGKNELWEIDRKAVNDNGTAIVSNFESRSFVGQNSNGFDLKKIAQFELWPRKIKGQVDFKLQWRPDASDSPEDAPCWYDWGTKTVCTKVEDCEQNVNACKTLKNYKAGYRNRLGFGTPPDDECEPQTMTPPRLGFEHQIKLTWTGHAAIKKFLIKSEIVEEDVFAPCEES